MAHCLHRAGGNQAAAGENRQMTMMNRLDARRQQMLIDLQREMADLVESGDMTANEANEWVNRAADRWAGE